MSLSNTVSSQSNTLGLSHSVGSILIVAGTAIGAGMLALPIISLEFGYLNSIFLLAAMWLFMTYVALITVELNLYFKQGLSVAAMSEKVLGPVGRYVSTFALSLLFYALIAAYISGGSSMAHTALEYEFGIQFPNGVIAIGFTTLLASFIYSCVQTTDYANRFFFTGKILFFFIMAALLSRHINVQSVTSINNSNLSAIWLAIPIFFTSFGFHGSIPSLYNYIGHDAKKLKTVFFIGSIIPLAIYILWQTVTIGVLPLDASRMFGSTESVNTFLSYLAITTNYGSSFLTLSKVFIFFSVTTSFLGVGLGLFAFVAETFKFDESVEGRLKTALISFLPPLFFAIFYPNGFILALGYAAIALSVLAVLMPCFMALILRSNYGSNDYQAPGGNVFLWIAIFIGVLVIAIEIAKKVGISFV